MKPIFLPFFILMIFTFSGYGQQDATANLSFFNSSLNTLSENPEQTKKVADYFVKNAESPDQKAAAEYLLFEYEKLYGNSTQSIEHLFEAKKNLNIDSDSSLKTLVLTAVAQTCRRYGMGSIATKYLEEASNIHSKIPLETENSIARIKFYQEQAQSLVSHDNEQGAIETIKNTEQYLEQIKEQYPAIYAEGLNAIAEHFQDLKEIDLANQYFTDAYTIQIDNQIQSSSTAARSLLGLGNILLKQRQFLKAREFLLKAEDIQLKEPDVTFQILSGLSTINKELDSLADSRNYYLESTRLSGTLMSNERNVRNTLLTLIQKDQEKSTANDTNKYYVIGGLIAGLLFMIIVANYFYNKKLDREYLHFQKIIKQIDKKEKIELASSKEITTETTASTGTNIPSETENAILKRLEAFEASDNYANPNMSLALLAKQMKTNTKYISEIIHTHKNKNFNTYINELRINYIIKLMQEDSKYLNYKVSYLAEKSGFSSHSAFTVVFKSITKITPKQFVTFLKKGNHRPS